VATPDDPDPLEFLGSYEYMSEGYYACQDAELAGEGAMPTCADALDAYVVPIALEKAAKAGVPVPEWLLTSEYFPVPAVCYGVNPFSRKYAVVRDEASREREDDGAARRRPRCERPPHVAPSSMRRRQA